MLRCDAYFPSFELILEFDGEQHFFPVDFAGKGEEWAKEQHEIIKQHDEIKNSAIPLNEIKLIRIAYFEPYSDEVYIRNKLIENGISLVLERSS